MVRTCLPWLVAALALGACGDETTSGPAAGLAPSFHREGGGRDAPQFSNWGMPVHLGSTINSASIELEVSISKDGLSLYFASNRSGNFDIWVSQRARVDDPWGPPQNLGPIINTSAREQAPFLTPDGHRMYFFSDRTAPGVFGGTDLYVARRRNKRDDFGWQPPENLGSGVNTSFNETLPVYFEDEVTRTTMLYFGSNRTGSPDIFASTLQPDETFGPAVRVEELSSPGRDRVLAIRRDGLEIFLGSDRAGPPLSPFDLWVATRANTSEHWSTPVNLGPVVNGAGDESSAALSFDGTALYFTTDRPGSASIDLWVTTRTRLHRTVLVDPNRSGDGSAKTIQEGIDMVAPGGRVRVVPGTYHEQVTVSKNDVVIVADDADHEDDDEPGAVVVDAHGHEFGFLVLNASGVTIEGFRVEHAHEADIFLNGATFTTIRKNVTTAAGHDGIELIASNDNLIEHNVAVDNLAENACGVNVAAGSKRNVVRDNRLVNNEWGIQIAGAPTAATLDNVISENRALGNRGNGIRNVGGASGTIIEDNRVVENGLAPSPTTTGMTMTAAGIHIGSGVGIVVRENRVSGNLLVELLMGAAATATFEDNECGTSSPPGLCEGDEDDDEDNDDDGDEGGP
jgi:parallel beta-helix repeat protein